MEIFGIFIYDDSQAKIKSTRPRRYLEALSIGAQGLQVYLDVFTLPQKKVAGAPACYFFNFLISDDGDS